MMRDSLDAVVREVFGSSASEGCREGERRWTLICKEEDIENVKFIASLREMTIKDLIHEIFSEYAEGNGIG